MRPLNGVYSTYCKNFHQCYCIVLQTVFKRRTSLYFIWIVYIPLPTCTPQLDNLTSKTFNLPISVSSFSTLLPDSTKINSPFSIPKRLSGPFMRIALDSLDSKSKYSCVVTQTKCQHNRPFIGVAFPWTNARSKSHGLTSLEYTPH